MRTFGEILSDLQRRALEIDCFHMSLVQNLPENPISFKGKGYIRQTKDDKLECKIYVEKVDNTDQLKWLMQSFSGKSGQLFSDSDYFNLTAKDVSGAVWMADGVMPECNWRSEEDSPIITGGLATLTIEGASTHPEHSAYLHFFEDVKIPLIPSLKDEFEFSTDDYKFTVRKLEAAFTIEVTTKCALPGSFPGRVQEAVRFMSAQSVSWRGLCVSDGKRQTFRLNSAVPRSQNTRFPPPIGQGKSSAHIDDCWRMFFLYLQYVLRNSKPTYWSYCSYHLDNAREASANSLDAWSYGLSIAVEGLTALLPSKKDNGTNALLQEMRETILCFIGKIDCYKTLIKRLDGTLAGMANEPPPDRMHQLIRDGRLDSSHVAAWKKLRNKFVHPKEVDLAELNERKLQDLIDMIHKVSVLMYHIVFYLIGYEGKYTDYATLGFPDKNYPLIAQSADQTE